MIASLERKIIIGLCLVILWTLLQSVIVVPKAGYFVRKAKQMVEEIRDKVPPELRPSN